MFCCKNADYTSYILQLNVILTECVHDMGLTRHLLHFIWCKHACVCKIDNIKLIVQALVYAVDMSKSLWTHVCISGMPTPKIWIICMQIVSQGKWSRFYELVHVATKV